MNETVRLAEWVAGTSFDDLPPDVVACAKLHILDALAAGFAGAPTPWVDMVAGLAHEYSVGTCSVIGRPWTASPSSAALCNGTMIGGFECESGHLSASVLPGVLAVAEERHLDGRAFLTAYTLGCEVLRRVEQAGTQAMEDEAGFHGPATTAAFGGAAGAGKAIGLSSQQLAWALGIAGSHGGGLLEFFKEGAMTKRLHLGRGAQMGLESALLASRGFTGPTTVLEGSHGFLKVYSPKPDIGALDRELGKRYTMMGKTAKAYPCLSLFNSVLEGAEKFRLLHDYRPSDVQRVAITAGHRMMEPRFLNRVPETILGAQYSLPWAAALALTRDISAPSVWRDIDFGDQEIRRIAGEMELREDASRFTGSHAAVELTVVGVEHSFSVTDWKGAATNPYTFEEMADKFRRYTADSIGRNRSDELVQRVSGLEDEQDVASLAALLRS